MFVRDEDSPYLRGVYTPAYTERTAHALPVKGRLPEELDGLFTQIGANPVAPPRRREKAGYSWFSQEGMVCGVRLRGGRAEWFRNRWIRSKQVCRALGEPRPAGPRRFFTDIVNTSVVCHGSMLLALVESGCLPARLTSTLDTVEYTDLRGALPHGFTSHPKLDPGTGELYAVVYSPLRSYADYVVITPEGVARKLERIPLGGRPMMHDIALTENHVVLFDLPVRFDPRAAVRGRFPWHWSERHDARIGILPREGSARNLRWFHVPRCFLFHTVNAFEQDGRIRIWALRYPRMFAGASEDPFEDGAGRPWEWSIDLATGEVAERQLDDRQQELPRTDPRRLGRPFRHYYSVGGGDLALREHRPDVLVKGDLALGLSEERRHRGGAVPTEPVFVPRGPGEDDGWILHFLLDPVHQESELVVLDARDFAGPPVASVRLPMRVPFGFHSSWIAGAELAAVDASLAGGRLAQPQGAGAAARG
jgi:carotenoid cleavage dioxygenase